MASTGSTFVRCQAVPAAEAVVGREGLPSSRDDPKHRYVVSHPWLSKAHPDPSGETLRALVDQLDLLGASDDDAVFMDYTGLPQHDGQDLDLQRLERERRWPKPGEHPAVRDQGDELRFKRALDSMEMLYSIGGIPVIVLPMGSDTAEGRGYFSRG
ncbi:unnamed protein product [Prorocentrum cordatum]|uniref:Amidase n=1 Tax=Prorocentrum cordatum TaxID=2364126 RepID=A0ABN9PLU8_9DINO|nr:unnamed protein product [Polarella glacialis]